MGKADHLIERLQAVTAIINEGRVGRPVFLRCVAQVTADAQLEAALREALDASSRWFGGEPMLMHEIGDGERHLTVLAKWAWGQGALVNLNVADEPGIDIMLLGSKGALYHEGFQAASKRQWVNESTGQRANEPKSQPASQPTFGVLLVAGMMTHQEGYASQFLADPRCRLVAVTDEGDVMPERAWLNRQLAEDLGVPYISDLEEALAREDVKLVSSCVEVERRGRVAVRCARAGKHLYLDKPLAGSLEDAKAIVAAVEEAGVKAQMFSSIYSPWAQAAKQAVADGRVGKLLAVHADVLFAKGHAGTAPEGFVRQEKERAEKFTFIEAKRELFDIGVYAVALVHWLTGCRTHKVFGMTGNYFFKEHIGCGVEDFGALALTLDNGLTASITGGRIGWMSHPQGGPNRVILVGTNGVLVCDAYRPRIEVYADEPPFTPPPPHPLDPMGMWQSTQREVKTPPKRLWVSPGDERGWQRADVQKFVDCIEQGREPEMNVREAAALVEVLLAGYVSAARGKEVVLPLETQPSYKS